MVINILRLDKDKFMNHVRNVLDEALDRIAIILKQYLIYEITQIPPSGSILAVGKPEWRENVMDSLTIKVNNTKKSLARKIGLINPQENILYQAMIIEYGMGTESDMSNPWIDEYLRSKFYHANEREGMKVYARKGKEVYNLDDGIWEMSEADGNYEIAIFRQKGSGFWEKVFGNSSTLAQSTFNAEIERAMKKIDISKFIINA